VSGRKKRKEKKSFFKPDQISGLRCIFAVKTQLFTLMDREKGRRRFFVSHISASQNHESKKSIKQKRLKIL